MDKFMDNSWQFVFLPNARSANINVQLMKLREAPEHLRSARMFKPASIASTKKAELGFTTLLRTT